MRSQISFLTFRLCLNRVAANLNCKVHIAIPDTLTHRFARPFDCWPENYVCFRAPGRTLCWIVLDLRFPVCPLAMSAAGSWLLPLLLLHVNAACAAVVADDEAAAGVAADLSHSVGDYSEMADDSIWKIRIWWASRLLMRRQLIPGHVIISTFPHRTDAVPSLLLVLDRVCCVD